VRIDRQCLPKILDGSLQIAHVLPHPPAVHVRHFEIRIELLRSRQRLQRLFRLSQEEYVLVLSVDHMITDGVSNVILSDEILALYMEMVGGLPSSLPRVPLQFADYAVWQQQIHENWLRDHEEYWKARLVRAPTIQLPFDKVKAESKSEYGIGGMTRISFDLPVTV